MEIYVILKESLFLDKNTTKFRCINLPSILYRFDTHRSYFKSTSFFNVKYGKNNFSFLKCLIMFFVDPFDYYFFHFAYHLINSAHQRYQICNDSPWTTIYYMLCCDYIIHFLPISPNQPIIPILNFYNGKNPVYTLPSYTK